MGLDDGEARNKSSYISYGVHDPSLSDGAISCSISCIDAIPDECNSVCIDIDISTDEQLTNEVTGKALGVDCFPSLMSSLFSPKN